MKYLFTTVSLLFSVLSNAQVPTQDLFFAHDFNGTFTAAIPQNFEPYLNSTALTQDLLGAVDRALSINEGQNMTFSNEFVQAGTTNGQLSVSLKMNIDYNFLMEMPDFTYASIFNNGDCFIRILKANIYLLQVGLNNGNMADGSFGYISIAQEVDPALLSAWNNVTLVYNGNPVNQTLELYYNGDAVLNTTQSLECAQGGNVIYTNYDMVFGGLADSPFKGAIDEVYIHNRALTASEIENIHNSTSFVAISETEEKPNFRIFPNPALDVIYVDSDSFDTIEIFDARGKRVFSERLRFGVNELNVQELKSGLYFMKQQQQTLRFTKL